MDSASILARIVRHFAGLAASVSLSLTEQGRDRLNKDETD
jgi:hypothetical protein